jgi:two-component system sensor histidine kinase DesK
MTDVTLESRSTSLLSAPVGCQIAAGQRAPSRATAVSTEPISMNTRTEADMPESSAPTGPTLPRANVAGEAVRLPRLWQGFVLAWLVVLGVAIWFVHVQLAGLTLMAALLALLALTAAYLWLTLYGALTGADLEPAGPSRSVLGRRLLVLAIMTLLVLVIIWLYPPGQSWWLVQNAIVAAGLALPPRLATCVGAGLVGLSIITSWLIRGQFQPILLMQVAFGAGAVAIRQLTIAIAQLQAARGELARLAVAEERLRFGRDLHDLLGHSLSVIVLKSELAGRLLSVEPAKAAAEIADVERSARQALREVRGAVAGYRQLTLQAELAAARELLAAAGIMALIVDDVGSLPAPLDSLLAWAVREGITNVIRHSRAGRCEISLRRALDWVRLEVRDDGRGAPTQASSRGSGLAGLAERVAAVGGGLAAAANPDGGFLLALQAPFTKSETGAEP